MRVFGVARDIPFPSVEPDAAPLCGIWLNQQWVTGLLSLVSHADNPYFWDNAPVDAVERAAYKLFLIIRKAQGMIGAIVPYASATPPPGTLPCDGSAHARADYPRLYAALPPPLIVDADTFRTPDLRGVFVLGASNAYPPLASGGSETVSLTISNLPSHTHSTAPHAHTYEQPIVGIDLEAPGVPDATAVGNPPITTTTSAETVTVNATGGDEPHDNMPPYIALSYAIVAV